MTLTIDGHQGREQNTPNTGKSNMKQVWRRETQPDQKTEKERERERDRKRERKIERERESPKTLKGKLPLYAVRECFLFTKNSGRCKRNE